MTKFKMFVVVAALMSLATPATAQDMGIGGKHQHGASKAADQPKKKTDDKAYKTALKSIPDSKEKLDPWHSMRLPRSADSCSAANNIVIRSPCRGE